MLRHILLPGSLGTEETMKRQWRVRREAVERPDGSQRWDRAFQAILSWSLANEQARAPGANASANGKVFDPSRIDARPKLGSTEIWELATDLHHPVHLHLVHFKVLSRSGRRPLPKDAGWKDTVDVLPGQVVRVISRFDGYRGKYVFHCHNLEHEDMMMMANFEVV